MRARAQTTLRACISQSLLTSHDGVMEICKRRQSFSQNEPDHCTERKNSKKGIRTGNSACFFTSQAATSLFLTMRPGTPAPHVNFTFWKLLCLYGSHRKLICRRRLSPPLSRLLPLSSLPAAATGSLPAAAAGSLLMLIPFYLWVNLTCNNIIPCFM